MGSTIRSDGKCDGEIKKRIAEAKRAFTKMKNILTNKNISLQIRKRGIKTFVWSIMTYGSEAWTISQTMTKRIEAFEMWCWRRMQKIAWIEKKSNEQVLQSINSERELIKIIRTRQMRFLGHVMRRGEIEHLSLTGKIEGKRAWGKTERHLYEEFGKLSRWKLDHRQPTASNSRQSEMAIHDRQRPNGYGTLVR